MFKIIVVLKVIAFDSYAEVTTQESETFKIMKSNSSYQYCFDYCKYAEKYKEKIGTTVNQNHELVDIIPSEEGVISSIYLQNDVCSVGMLPLAGIYKLSMKHPHAKSIHADILKSKDYKKKITIYLKVASTEIIAASLEE